MLNLNWTTLGFGLVLALVDATMMPLIKGVSKRALPRWVMLIPTLVYAIDPWIFLSSLKLESMVVMNFVWDLMSDLLVTFFGIVLLGERLPATKAIGVVLSFISIFFLTWEGDGWGEQLERWIGWGKGT
jgi:drug/metabolite transporter (DMT)-like permease